jgi:S-adenosylmethionine hydrolase
MRPDDGTLTLVEGSRIAAGRAIDASSYRRPGADQSYTFHGP